MTTIHATDNEIQEYEFNNIFNTTIAEHIKDCRRCSEKAAQYKALFIAIKQQDAQVFDFNVSQLVVTQLTAQIAKQSIYKYWAYYGNGAAAIMLAILFYMITTSLPDLFNGFIGLLVITALGISFFVYMDMYRNFKAKMNFLDIC